MLICQQSKTKRVHLDCLRACQPPVPNFAGVADRAHDERIRSFDALFGTLHLQGEQYSSARTQSTCCTGQLILSVSICRLQIPEQKASLTEPAASAGSNYERVCSSAGCLSSMKTSATGCLCSQTKWCQLVPRELSPGTESNLLCCSTRSACTICSSVGCFCDLSSILLCCLLHPSVLSCA